MNILHDNEEDYGKVVNADEGNQAHLSHEIVASDASYKALETWGKHQASTGAEVNHGKMKDFLAGAAGEFAVNIAESKGRDILDKRE
ncbi:hypothetical protein ABOM_003098 [Aspergillus bombycis]|uniref:Uncharacterized protein n=1 Tax=Aspergillus bombycis TaxID=109264 RepID=A0A1F8ABB7_9EURO|nr:hypothetical protein ABOM_003098 [Aspergillus bombycis]OGM48987.1 hypothetical protein ABOM_003098 [Aspergillus bombycis]